jgi:hypothetical protein
MSSLLVFNRVYRLEIQSVVLVILLCELLPCNLLSGSPYTPPLPKGKVQYIQKVCGWEGVLSCDGDHILTRFTVYKIAFPPEKKT